jgi:hypothetical protein
VGKPHVLNQSKKTETPSLLAYFDSESWANTEISEADIEQAKLGKVESEHKLYLICCTFLRKAKKGGYTERLEDYYINDLNPDTWTQDSADHISSSFWHDVDNYIPKGRKLVMFAHNAKYDSIATNCVPALVDLGYTVTAFSDSNPFFLKLSKYSEDIAGNFSTDKSIVILSSTNFYQCSLAKLGDKFGIPKTEIDYEMSSISEAVPYCRNDVLILKTAMTSFINFVINEDLGNFSMTIAGQAFTAYRHRFMNKKIYIHKSEESLILERDAYAGGRNECWNIGRIDGPIYKLDFNSMYPFRMKTEIYPTKLISYNKHCTIDELKYFIYKRNFLTIANVKVNTDVPVFFKKCGKLTFPVGEFTTTLSTPELKYALEHNMILEVNKVNVYQSADIFSGYIDYFYDKRLEASANEDEILKFLYKLFLNTLYGKFGQKCCNYELIGQADPKVIKEERVFDADVGTEYIIKIFGGSIFKKEPLPDGKNDAFNAFPAISAHVTAYARMGLWHCIEIAGQENIYYMDTDSLFMNKIGYERMVAAGLVDAHRLGAMKLEPIVEEKKDKDGNIIQPEILISNGVTIKGLKDYKFDEWSKSKIKGVSKNSKYIGQDKDGNDQYINQVWRGFAKFIKEGQLNHYKNELMIKTLKREYDKGLIVNGKVIPFTYKNNERVS